MTLSGLANISAVVQGQIGYLITLSGYLIRMMKMEVLEASLPGLALKPVVVGGGIQPGDGKLVDEDWRSPNQKYGKGRN